MTHFATLTDAELVTATGGTNDPQQPQLPWSEPQPVDPGIAPKQAQLPWSEPQPIDPGIAPRLPSPTRL